MKIGYRIVGGSADYTALADDSLSDPASTQDRISGYQPALHASPQIEALPVAGGAGFASFIYGRAGQVTVAFGVARQHGTADNALQFINDQLIAFGAAGQFHLKITVGVKTTYLAFCAITTFQPEPHSDQSSFIRYAFTGSTYTDSEPA